MTNADTKRDLSVDVVVLGQHPASFLAAALLRHQSKLKVLHARIPGAETTDRLILISPEFFRCHPILSNLRKKLKLTQFFGLRFLCDDPTIRSEYRTNTEAGCIGRFKSLRDEFVKLAEAEGVELLTPKTIQIHRLDETGIDLSLGKSTIRARSLILGDNLPAAQMSQLGLPGVWPKEVVHRFTYVRCKQGKNLDLGNSPLMPMSLDLHGKLIWGWLLPGDGEFQIQVEQPIDTIEKIDGQSLLNHWCNVLKSHKVLAANFNFPSDAVNSIDLPLAGALVHDGIANRTLLIGPAGGFYSACGEDIYPNCWSAILAAEVLKKALREEHLQDALNAHRLKLRTALGDYLRGPHENLRFLLPLVYKNVVMTDRLAEAILFSKSVVR
jgi:hypothetical protein